ncbi:nuclear transport factor 2 family protein [Shewanella maritima]|uniref:nuclear transport factor 2 family protein n=1 Tax=Shewanella maritima TaxID=2520507 RepID=UPI0037352C70
MISISDLGMNVLRITTLFIVTVLMCTSAGLSLSVVAQQSDVSSVTPINQKSESNPQAVDLVHTLIHAFNGEDLPLIEQLVADEVKWFNVSVAKMDIQTEGKAALMQSMRAYFDSKYATKSTILDYLSSANFVSTVEKVTYNSSQGKRVSQCSVAVFEIEHKLVKAVWYYPSHKCD